MRLDVCGVDGEVEGWWTFGAFVSGLTVIIGAAVGLWGGRGAGVEVGKNVREGTLK